MYTSSSPSVFWDLREVLPFLTTWNGVYSIAQVAFQAFQIPRNKATIVSSGNSRLVVTPYKVGPYQLQVELGVITPFITSGGLPCCLSWKLSISQFHWCQKRPDTSQPPGARYKRAWVTGETVALPMWRNYSDGDDGGCGVYSLWGWWRMWQSLHRQWSTYLDSENPSFCLKNHQLCLCASSALNPNSPSWNSFKKKCTETSTKKRVSFTFSTKTVGFLNLNCWSYTLQGQVLPHTRWP